ncbi:hemagglutinin repeat-containing protein [Campylobacter concisus]|uniref:hemagglutinin repeat-containing protein n=2 Tax=Campylobacter concisus TaxID=199 RepID=UPI000CD7E78C|nr:hemagglutinin repeat-containing protein [Campylobacter concisus]
MVGIDYSDIEEVSDILEEYRDEEKYYKENILLATQNVNAKTLALVSQMAAAAASSGTYGFSVGVRADLATTKQESSLKQTSSNKSSLNAKHININSTKDISITGSDLASKEDMSLNSNNLNINSSEDSLKYKSNTRSLTTGFGFTFYGANSSSLELGTNSLKQSEQSLTNNNSHLYSPKDMNINTANDATIKGANLRADERLNLKVGNNLSLESTRDIKDASSKSKGINLSASYSGATNAKNFASGDRSLSSVGASISKSNSNTKIKQTNLSSITANELNVEVGKNTHLKGSLLAAGEYDKDNTFIDNHNLNLKTNTLSYENLSNTSYNKGSSLSIGANYSVGKKDEANKNSQDKSATSSYSSLKSINYSNHRNLSYTLSKNLATLGSGNIEIADKDNSDDLTRLNRDTTKLTKDLVNTSISSNVDASIDARVFSKEGRKEIAKEIVDTSTIIDAIKQISTTDRANIFSFFKEVSKQYKVLNGVREEVANSPELQAFLSSSTTTEAQRKEAMGLITLAVMKNLGYLPNDIKSIYTDERGYNGEEIKGYTSLQTGASYINFKNITNMKDLVKTITHENQRSMDIQDHRDIDKNRDDDTKYASNFSDFATRYFSHALWLNDKGFSKTPLTTAVTSSIVNNNREFAKLDKNLGANRVEAYSRPVGFGKNHMFIVVDGSNYKEGITLASLGAKDFIFGGDTEIVVKDINHISKEEDVASTDRDHYLNKEWEEKQVIEIPRGMTEREFDERVLENARNYNKMFENNRYPNIASTISESFFGGYNNNEDSLLRNSNTFVDDVIEFSGGYIMNFKNTPLQNSTELRNITEQLNKIAPNTIDFGALMQ